MSDSIKPAHFLHSEMKTFCTPLGLMLFIVFCSPSGALAQGCILRVAVASNFAKTLASIIEAYEQEADCHVVPSSNSSGKHYAQIKQGAPFDIFLAADSDRPRVLEEEGYVVPGSRFTYALGQLVVWGRFLPAQTIADQMLNDNIRHIAIANPAVAPYGVAAQQVLEFMGLWQKLKPKIVMGENINQTFQFVATGNAQLGFIAQSQLKQSKQFDPGFVWKVPYSLHLPIEQQVVLLNDSKIARDFMVFLKNDVVAKIIRESGYRTLENGN